MNHNRCCVFRNLRQSLEVSTRNLNGLKRVRNVDYSQSLEANNGLNSCAAGNDVGISLTTWSNSLQRRRHNQPQTKKRSSADFYELK